MGIIKIYIKGKNEKSCVVIHYRSYIKIQEGCSDNACEWIALLDAMELIKVRNYNNVVIYTDSKMLYFQLNKILDINKHDKKWSYKKMRDYYLEWNKMSNDLREKDIVYSYIEPKNNIARGCLK